MTALFIYVMVGLIILIIGMIGAIYSDDEAVQDFVDNYSNNIFFVCMFAVVMFGLFWAIIIPVTIIKERSK